MKRAILFASSLFVLAVQGFGQVSPRPVADAELRDDRSIRMRSMQLERFKRDSKKAVLPQTSKVVVAKLGEIKEDFESIQTLQDKIIKTYKSGKTINYNRIAVSAAAISKKALRLDQNLFGAETKDFSDQSVASWSVRDLIIELDNAIGRFINSPIFESNKVVDTKASEAAELDLRRVIGLSDALANASQRASKK